MSYRRPAILLWENGKDVCVLCSFWYEKKMDIDVNFFLVWKSNQDPYRRKLGAIWSPMDTHLHIQSRTKRARWCNGYRLVTHVCNHGLEYISKAGTIEKFVPHNLSFWYSLEKEISIYMYIKVICTFFSIWLRWIIRRREPPTKAQ
jgi:hypothetical protein